MDINTKNQIPCESALRKGYADDIHNGTMDKIKENFQLKKCGSVSLQNAIVGALNENCAGNIFLPNSDELQKADHSTIRKIFDSPMS